MIVRDFNVDLLKGGDQADLLISAASELGLQQLISSATRITAETATCIDHVYSKTKKSLRSFSITTDISDHNIIMALIDDDKVDSKPIMIRKRWIAKEDYDNIKLFLKEENWDCMVGITTLQKADLWFQRNKLNLNPAKTRYMIFNSKTEETNLVKIRDQFIERVLEKGIEKSFKLAGINIDEKLKWTYKSSCKKINSANMPLQKHQKNLMLKTKK